MTGPAKRPVSSRHSEPDELGNAATTPGGIPFTRRVTPSGAAPENFDAGPTIPGGTPFSDQIVETAPEAPSFTELEKARQSAVLPTGRRGAAPVAPPASPAIEPPASASAWLFDGLAVVFGAGVGVVLYQLLLRI